MAAMNILNKQPRTADKGGFSSLGVGRGVNNFSQQKRIMLRRVNKERLGTGLILWYDLLNRGQVASTLNAVMNIRVP